MGGLAGEAMKPPRAVKWGTIGTSVFNSCRFKNASGVQCNGLFHRGEGDVSAKACETACCNSDTCMTWQWADKSKDHGAGCWTGKCTDTPMTQPEWVGGNRMDGSGW